MNYMNASLLKFLAALLFLMSSPSIATAASEPFDSQSSDKDFSNSDLAGTQAIADRVGLGKEFQGLLVAKQRGQDA